MFQLAVCRIVDMPQRVRPASEFSGHAFLPRMRLEPRNPPCSQVRRSKRLKRHSCCFFRAHDRNLRQAARQSINGAHFIDSHPNTVSTVHHFQPKRLLFFRIVNQKLNLFSPQAAIPDKPP